jgi:D-alanyl-lipoteichoic acid acyltransferase DltB (MBOAT superfamily)
MTRALAAGLVLFILVNVAAFYTPLYRGFLDPQSSTGSFEAAVDRFAATKTDPHRDVLVVGDSRIYAGLDPAAASAASNGLHFLNGAVPGTTPRCWYVFLKAIDPNAARFRAIVIPVDTYADDDSAIGSVDGDDRAEDLHYVALATSPSDVLKIAASFPEVRERLGTALDLILRGPELRDDVQAFVSDPAARIRALANAGDATYDPLAAHPRTETLAGMRVDFERNQIVYPPSVSASERIEMERQVLRVAAASPSYALYRRHWLGPIVARYAAAGVPVIVVRIPTRPAHRDAGAPPSGSLAELARAGARLVDPRNYLALEKPELFADHDHLNAAGSARFSALLGRDVAQRLADASPSTYAPFPIPTISPTPLVARNWSLRTLVSFRLPLEFQSYDFAIFLAIVAAIFYATPKRGRRFVLLVASYFFYWCWNGWYAVFLVALTLSDFAIALALERITGRSRHALLALGVAANLAFLGTFKYANFATGTIASLLGLRTDPWLISLFVPIGISFHTFQSISYLVDVYRAKTPAVRNVFDYALYLAFFPQLLSGPIVRAGLFFGEFFHWKAPNAADVSYGLGRIAFGLFKKLAIADQFAPISDSYFGAVASHPGAPAAWSAVFAFSMQIYFDFSGYSDIAIGCARLFGFVFPENFNMPYLAVSVTDFWHRWHMTLSTWLRDYLYIPLGGNRDGTVATLRNIMITMLLGGLWHGAQWTFVAWGGVHGALLSIERLAGIGRAGDVAANRAVYALRAAFTFAVVSLAWVLFRAQSWGTAASVYRALFTGGAGETLLTGWPAILAIGIVAFGAVRVAVKRWPQNVSWLRLSPAVRAGTFVALALAVELLSWPGPTATFIYFKF